MSSRIILLAAVSLASNLFSSIAFAARQRSLVIAIQQASPLPAPASPTVFNTAVSMTFTGFEYRPDSPGEDSEIEIPRQA